VRESRAVDTNTAYIERGNPWENGYIESFGQTVIDSRRRHYNRIRLHAPEVFVPGASWRPSQT
jgi:hypothetical protein